VADVYEETLIELTRRDERRRALLLDNLIDGRPSYGEFAGKLASAVGLPDKGRFVAVSADVPATGSEGLPRADHVLRRHGIRSTWRLRVDEQVGVIALDEPLGVIKELLESVAVCRAGLSAEYPDLRDTAANVALAALARRCIPPGNAGIATLDAHPLGVLLAGAPEIAAFVAKQVLGPVLALEPEERQTLLETFAAWVAADGSAAAAARDLSCHRNTVRNRLQRLTELTGRSVTDPRALVELCAGAEAIRLLDLAAEH
jgi:hypothetical protein